jgi:hypothetical protein
LAKSEGRRKATIPKRKANLLCRRAVYVEVVDAIAVKYWREDVRVITGLWISTGGA